MEENKQAICDKLAEALRLTRNCRDDLIGLEYEPTREQVTVHFIGGDIPVNVAMDSGTAMIRDIMRALP